MELVANKMAQRLSLVAQQNIKIEIICHKAVETEPLSALDQSYALFSLVHYVAQLHIPISLIEKQLIRFCDKVIQSQKGFPYFLTIFQSLDRSTLPDSYQERRVIISRIRAINLLALRLSQSSHCGVLDLDSMFTRLGGQNIGTDFTLKGELAHDIAADFISTTLLEDLADSRISLSAEMKTQLLAGGYKGTLQRSLQRIFKKDGIEKTIN